MNHLREGNWHLVLKQLQSTRLDLSIVQSIYEQIVRELVLEREWGVAQALLREQNAVLGWGTGGEGHVLQELWDLTQVREPPPTVEKVF